MRLGDCDADCCLVDGLLRGKGVEDRDVAEEVGGDEGWEGQRTGDGEPVGEAVLEDGADDGNADGEAEGAEEGVPGGCMLGGTLSMESYRMKCVLGTWPAQLTCQQHFRLLLLRRVLVLR